jgi:signal transduction histidine kinase
VGGVDRAGGSEQPEAPPRPPLLHRVTPLQLQIVDLGLAAFAVVVTAGRARANDGSPFGGVSHVPLAVLLAFALGLSIALRRRTPLTALSLSTAAVAVAVATTFGQGWGPESFIAIPMYQVASVRDRHNSLPALAVVCVALLVASLVGDADYSGNGVASLPLVAGIAAWFVGDSVRVRRVYVAGLAEQAAQSQREMLERAQRSVAEERLQIARELHDVVAHSLSVIAVQSGVGRHVIDEQPAEAKKALAAVEATSRAALTELRRMLGVLRRDESQPAALAPAPGVAALDSLVERVRAAGFVVSLESKSTKTGTLSPSVQLSIYRIVQEALTNVVKHAGPATVRVEIRDETDGLVLEVSDDGLGLASALADSGEAGVQSHHGIIGMRERVALFDGSLSAGPCPGGGFRVVASFPLDCLTSS